MYGIQWGMHMRTSNKPNLQTICHSSVLRGYENVLDIMVKRRRNLLLWA